MFMVENLNHIYDDISKVLDISHGIKKLDLSKKFTRMRKMEVIDKIRKGDKIDRNGEEGVDVMREMERIDKFVDFMIGGLFSAISNSHMWNFIKLGLYREVQEFLERKNGLSFPVDIRWGLLRRRLEEYQMLYNYSPDETNMFFPGRKITNLMVMVSRKYLTIIKHVLQASKPETQNDLLNICASVNKQDMNGNTVLHFALTNANNWQVINHNDYDIVYYLVSMGADMLIENNFGVTPYSLIIDKMKIDPRYRIYHIVYIFGVEKIPYDIIWSVFQFLEHNDIMKFIMISKDKIYDNGNHYIWMQLYKRDCSDTLPNYDDNNTIKHQYMISYKLPYKKIHDDMIKSATKTTMNTFIIV